MTEFPQTPRNRVRRLPDRGRYDKDSIFPIIDEALVCHVAIAEEGRPVVIPMLHARVGDTLYLHGSIVSRLLKHIQAGGEVCATFTLLDGLVLARSVFHHSVNYRSAMVFGRGRLVNTDEEKMSALEAITEHVCPGRWAEARRPNPKELNATLVVAIEIESASAKVRSGPPKDDAEDDALPVWAGVLPLALQPGPPQAAEGVNAPVPDYVACYRRTG